MSDLLKEAIADAKAVRETALQNAKMALEEAFTPQLKSMLVAKLKEDDLEGEEEYGDEEVPEEEPEIPADEMSYEDEMGDEEGGEEEFGDEEGGEEEFEEEGLDLEAIIRELEAELSEDNYEEGLGESEESDDKPVEEASEESDEESVNEEEEEVDEAVIEDAKDDDEDDDKEEVDEVDQSSAIGKGTGKGNTDRSSGIGTAGKAVEKVKFESVQAELKEYKEAVTYLKDKLHEVNILNAKLLFTNKLFKEFVLDNNQKLKVVETFDRAQTTREIKLVYSTLAEQFGDNNVITKRKSIKESASTAVGSTKPSKESSKVITEEASVANRFRKLAGILKD
tara:strand:+ start:200 stop:1213 length:1014 start_codon:yes stop_codon:yes gene_type:complete